MARIGKLREEDRDAAVLLSKQLSEVICGLMEHAGETQKSLAPKLGLSRPTLNILLNASDGKNLWRLPTLSAVARVFHITVADLFRALDPGENEVDDPFSELAEKALLATRAGSRERLRWLVRRALRFFISFSDNRGEKELMEREDYERYLRCTPLEIEQGASAFWKDYTELKLGNVATVGAAMDAFAYAEHHGGLGKIPFWVALKESYKAK